jgi:hypothetical protein
VCCHVRWADGRGRKDERVNTVSSGGDWIWYRWAASASGDGIVSGASAIAHLKLGLEKGLLTLPDGVISCAEGLMMRRNSSKCIGVVIRS